MPTEIKITKLITNQIILGKTTETETHITITDPYMIIPSVSELQIFPYDEAILGKKLEEIKVPIDNTIYTTEAPQKIKTIYLEDKMNLVTPDKKIIL